MFFRGPKYCLSQDLDNKKTAAHLTDIFSIPKLLAKVCPVSSDFCNNNVSHFCTKVENVMDIKRLLQIKLLL